MLPILFGFILYSQADPAPLENNCPADAQALVSGTQVRGGKEIYNDVCSMCHGADAKGTPGVFPPLVPSEWVVNETTLTNIILRGLVGEIFVGGERYASAMPGFHEKLSDTEVLALVRHLQTLNEKQSTFTEEDIKQIRTENVPMGSISGHIGLSELLPPPAPKSTSFWKGCHVD